jgi:hypothetical protein
MVYVDKDALHFFSEIVVTSTEGLNHLLSNRRDRLNMKELTAIFYKTKEFNAKLLDNETGINLITFNSQLNTKRIISNYSFSGSVGNAILVENIRHYGMILDNKGEFNFNYTLRKLVKNFRNKKTLIITENSRMKEIEDLKSDNIDIATNPTNSKYEIVIEYPFVNGKTFLERRNLVDINLPDKTFITLFTQDKLQEVNEVKLNNYFTIEITNLLSHFSENKTLKIEGMYNEIGYKEDKNFIDFYDNLRKNEYLMKKVAHIFYRQNLETESKNYDNISLLNGEVGYKTFLIYSLSSKQKEE